VRACVHACVRELLSGELEDLNYSHFTNRHNW